MPLCQGSQGFIRLVISSEQTAPPPPPSGASAAKSKTLQCPCSLTAAKHTSQRQQPRQLPEGAHLSGQDPDKRQGPGGGAAEVLTGGEQLSLPSVNKGPETSFDESDFRVGIFKASKDTRRGHFRTVSSREGTGRCGE